MLEHADVAGGAADIHHRTVQAARQKSSSAHRVGGPGGKGRDWIALGIFHAHQRAVVLAQVDGRLDADLGKRHMKRVHDVDSEVSQAGVHDRCVLTLEKTPASALMREAYGHPGKLGLKHPACLFLEFIVDWTEDRGDRYRPDAFAPDILGRPLPLSRVQLRDPSPIALMSYV